jgi:hypothetical protein
MVAVLVIEKLDIIERKFAILALQKYLGWARLVISTDLRGMWNPGHSLVSRMSEVGSKNRKFCL